MMRPSPSRTSTCTSSAAKTWRPRSSTAPTRSPCPPSSPRSPSASSSCRCSCWSGSPATCSCRSPRRSSSPCWRPTCSRGPSCRRSPNTGCSATKRTRRSARSTRCGGCSSCNGASSSGSGSCARRITGCSSAPCAAGRALPCRSWVRWRPPPCSPSPSAASCRASDRTSSRASMPARSSSTCGVPPASASMRPRPCEIASIVDNIGIPYSGINLAYSTSAPVGPGDADIYVNLTADHRPTAPYVRLLRERLTALYASTTFAFLPADIVSQILNFGLPAPIDVQVAGFNVAANRAYAQALLARLHRIPGIVDLRIQQAFDYPTLNVEVDRSRAALLGLSETDVASDLLVSLSGSSQTTLSFWIDPKSGTQYAIAAQTPQFRLASLGDLATTPVTAAAATGTTGGGAGGAGSSGNGGRTAQLLANLASFHRSVA